MALSSLSRAVVKGCLYDWKWAIFLKVGSYVTLRKLFNLAEP